MDWLTPHDHPDHPAVLAWQAHLDAGRLGGRTELAPALALNLQRTEALLLAHARRERRA